jgi:hypothetical protein
MKRLATGALACGTPVEEAERAGTTGVGGEGGGAGGPADGALGVGAAACPGTKGVPHASQRSDPGGPSTSQVGQTTPRLLARKRDIQEVPRHWNLHQAGPGKAFIEGLIS